MQALFEWEFNSKVKLDKEVSKIVKMGARVDKQIQNAATSRPLEQINKIDLAILRLAIFEIITKNDTPTKVVIDEAIELGKEYGSDSSASFINGVLGRVVETI